MNISWDNIGLSIQKTKDYQLNCLKNNIKGFPLYFKIIDNNNKDIYWKNNTISKHMIWTNFNHSKIIDNALYPGIIWDKDNYYKNLYNITNSKNKQLKILSQTFEYNHDLSIIPEFNPNLNFIIYNTSHVDWSKLKWTMQNL